MTMTFAARCVRAVRCVRPLSTMALMLILVTALPAVAATLDPASIGKAALHNRMMGETSNLYFTHFWGKGKTADLARGFRAALDTQAHHTSH